MDNGHELRSVTLAEWGEEHDVMLDFIKPAKLTQISYIERFNRAHREAVFDIYIYGSLRETSGHNSKLDKRI